MPIINIGNTSLFYRLRIAQKKLFTLQGNKETFNNVSLNGLVKNVFKVFFKTMGWFKFETPVGCMLGLKNYRRQAGLLCFSSLKNYRRLVYYVF